MGYHSFYESLWLGVGCFRLFYIYLWMTDVFLVFIVSLVFVFPENDALFYLERIC